MILKISREHFLSTYRHPLMYTDVLLLISQTDSSKERLNNRNGKHQRGALLKSFFWKSSWTLSQKFGDPDISILRMSTG